jgi:hypothetical protein
MFSITPRLDANNAVQAGTPTMQEQKNDTDATPQFARNLIGQHCLGPACFFA